MSRYVDTMDVPRDEPRAAKRPADGAPAEAPPAKRPRANPRTPATDATARIKKLVAKINGLLRLKHVKDDLSAEARAVAEKMADYKTAWQMLANETADRGRQAVAELLADPAADPASYARIEEQLMQAAAMLPPADDGAVVGDPASELSTRQQRWRAVRWAIWALAMSWSQHAQLAFDVRHVLTHAVLVALVDWIENPTYTPGLSMPLLRALLGDVPFRAGVRPFDAWPLVEPIVGDINLSIGRDLRRGTVDAELPGLWLRLAARLALDLNAMSIPLDFEARVFA